MLLSLFNFQAYNAHYLRFSKRRLIDQTCATDFYRHEICVYGLEDLAWLDTLPFLFVNQMFPEFDFGVAFCLAETLFNRSMLSGSENGLQSSTERIESFQDAYANRPQVCLHIMSIIFSFI